MLARHGLRFEVWPWQVEPLAEGAQDGGGGGTFMRARVCFICREISVVHGFADGKVLVSGHKVVDHCVYYTMGQAHYAFDPDLPGSQRWETAPPPPVSNHSF